MTTCINNGYTTCNWPTTTTNTPCYLFPPTTPPPTFWSTHYVSEGAYSWTPGTVLQHNLSTAFSSTPYHCRIIPILPYVGSTTYWTNPITFIWVWRQFTWYWMDFMKEKLTKGYSDVIIAIQNNYCMILVIQPLDFYKLYLFVTVISCTTCWFNIPLFSGPFTLKMVKNMLVQNYVTNHNQ